MRRFWASSVQFDLGFHAVKFERLSLPLTRDIDA